MSIKGISLFKGDITRFRADAIANAANESLLGGGGVDGAIHAAAGPRLLEECRTLGGCPTGSARITRGYDLPAKYVLHTVGPVWTGGEDGEPELLASCYRSCMELAARYGLHSVAFPLISAGVYRYPKEEAIAAALETLAPYADDFDSTLVLYDDITYADALAVKEKLTGEAPEPLPNA